MNIIKNVNKYSLSLDFLSIQEEIFKNCWI